MGFLRELAGAFAAGYRGDPAPTPPPPPLTPGQMITQAEQQAAAAVDVARTKGRRYVDQQRARLARIQSESATRIARILERQRSGWE